MSMMDYTNQPTPAYSSLPPPPPFVSVDSQNDLTAMDSAHSYGPGGDGGYSTGYSTPAYPGTPQKEGGHGGDRGGVNMNLDLSKFKTKVCRHYLNGNLCPFEARCAFAHSQQEARANRAIIEANRPAPPSYFESPIGSDAGAADAEGSAAMAETPEDNSRSSTPPSYPTRYRFDPYNIHSGVVYSL